MNILNLQLDTYKSFLFSYNNYLLKMPLNLHKKILQLFEYSIYADSFQMSEDQVEKLQIHFFHTIDAEMLVSLYFDAASRPKTRGERNGWPVCRSSGWTFDNGLHFPQRWF